MQASKRQLALARSLGNRKDRSETGLFLVEGARLCGELLDSGWQTDFVLLSEDTEATARAVAERFEKRGVPVLEAAPHEFDKVSDTVNSQGILAVARIREQGLDQLRFKERALVLALDAVSDPGNVGTVIRTAAWFGADALLLGKGCADLFNPKTVRATMGGIFHLSVCRDVPLEDALPRLKQHGFVIAAATTDGSPDWMAWTQPKRSALLLGSEARGIAPELLVLCGARYCIPRRGAGESLNVAVSAGIFLSAVAREKGKVGC